MPNLGRRSWVLVACLLALVAHGSQVWRPTFSYDDVEAIVENPVVRGDLGWKSVVDRDQWHHRGSVGQYRPTATASLRLDYALWGADARGFRATNLGLHAAVVAFLVLLSWRFAPGRIPLGALIVAAHPVLSDSVAWISGRTSLVSALPLVAATWFFTERRGSLALGCAVAFVATLLGVGGKEDAVLLLPLVVLAAGKRAFPIGLASMAALGLVLIARDSIYGNALPSAVGAPFRDLGLTERLAFGGRALWQAARGVFALQEIAPSYRGAPAFEPANLPGRAWWLPSCVVLLLPLVAASQWRRRGWLVAGTVALTLLPLTQVFPLGEPYATRYLYLPLVVLAPVVTERATRWNFLGTLVLLVALGVLSGLQARHYATRASHAEAVIALVPDDAVAWTSLGVARAEQGDLDGARRALERALEIEPEHGRAWSNLASLAIEAGDLQGGIEALERSLEHFPRNGIAWTNLGSARLRAEDPSGALAAYDRAIEVLPGLAAAWRGRGAALEGLSRHEEALESVSRALELDPSDALARQRRQRIQSRGIGDRDPANL